MMAMGLLRKAMLAPPGPRESQSMAFLKTPGMELLYSGVTSSRPSAATIFSFSTVTASGMPLSASTSPS